MRKTWGSRSISSAIAWPSASLIWMPGISAFLTRRRVDVPDDLVPGRLGLRLRERDRVLDPFHRRLVERLELALGDAEREEPPAGEGERVLRLPDLDFFLGAVL